jgi:hypothetical protein
MPAVVENAVMSSTRLAISTTAAAIITIGGIIITNKKGRLLDGLFI